MRALVVGGAGFVGSHLVDRLLAEGHAVDVVDDLSGGSLANLADARASGGHALTFHQCPADEPGLGALLARRPPDVAYLLASPPETTDGPGDVHPVEPLALALGTTTTLHVVSAARAAGVGKVVAAVAATALYADPTARDLPVKEGHPFGRDSVGAIAAASMVDLLTVARQDHALEFTVLAVDTVIGPRLRHGAAGALLRAATAGLAAPVPGDGRGTADIVHVDDVVDALVRAAVRGSGLVINVGTGTGTAFAELARVAGAPALDRGRAGGNRPPRFALANVRARIHLGWVPFTPWEDAVASTVGWLRGAGRA